MSGLWPKRAEWAAQVLNSAAAGEALQMNAGYFFRLLEHMTAGAFEKHAIISCRCMCFSASLTFSCSLQLSIRRVPEHLCGRQCMAEPELHYCWL